MPQFSAQQVLKRDRLAMAIATDRVTAPDSGIKISSLSAAAVAEPVSRRAMIILRVATDAGIEGVAEMRAGIDVQASLATLQKNFGDLIGSDAQARQSLLSNLARSNAVSGPFIAALDMALLDIAGKISEAPVFQVLSGRTRTKARALARLEGSSERELMASLDRAVEAGHRAFVVPLNLPADGIRGRQYYREVRQLLDRMLQATNGKADFVLDGQGQLEASQVVYLAREFDDFRLLWLDEPFKQTTNAARERVADESVTPVGLGRNSADLNDFQDWLRSGSLDVVRPDVSRIGIEAIRKLAAHAETHYVAVSPVNTGGPIGTVAGLHVAASIPNFFNLEIPLPSAARDRAMRSELFSRDCESVEEGFLTLPTGPGLGITLNEDALKRYSIK